MKRECTGDEKTVCGCYQQCVRRRKSPACVENTTSSGSLTRRPGNVRARGTAAATSTPIDSTAKKTAVQCVSTRPDMVRWFVYCLVVY